MLLKQLTRHPKKDARVPCKQLTTHLVELELRCAGLRVARPVCVIPGGWPVYGSLVFISLARASAGRTRLRLRGSVGDFGYYVHEFIVGSIGGELRSGSRELGFETR